MTDEVLTIKEIAEMLELTEKTVDSMAQRGERPMYKVRGPWRLRRADFEAWMEERARQPRLGGPQSQRRGVATRRTEGVARNAMGGVVDDRADSLSV